MRLDGLDLRRGEQRRARRSCADGRLTLDLRGRGGGGAGASGAWWPCLICQPLLGGGGELRAPARWRSAHMKLGAAAACSSSSDCGARRQSTGAERRREEQGPHLASATIRPPSSPYARRRGSVIWSASGSASCELELGPCRSSGGGESSSVHGGLAATPSSSPSTAPSSLP
jgi:hypothetical protein